MYERPTEYRIDFLHGIALLIRFMLKRMENCNLLQRLALLTETGRESQVIRGTQPVPQRLTETRRNSQRLAEKHKDSQDQESHRLTENEGDDDDRYFY